MVAAMACAIANDAIVKHVGQTVPAAQLIFVRGAIATALLLAVARLQSAPSLRPALSHPWVLARAAIDSVATLAFMVSLFHLPLANVAAINLAAPLFMVALAVPLLRERVDAGRWATVVLGFVGVLLVIQPGLDGFNAWALLCLFAALLQGLRDMTTRWIPAAVPSLSITVVNAVGVTGVAGVGVALQGWQALAPRDLIGLASAAVFLAFAYLLLVRCMRTGDVSVVAPWRYTGLLWALGLGWLIWGDVPDALGWLGIGLLVAAGLHGVRRLAATTTRR